MTEYPSNVRNLRAGLNKRKTPSERKFIQLCKTYGVPYDTNVPFKLDGYKSIGWGFVDVLIFGEIAIELDGVHHRNDNKQYDNDIDKKNKLYHTCKIPTIRINNETLNALDDKLWASFFTILKEWVQPTRRKKRKMQRLFYKYDFYEVFKIIDVNYKNRQRLQTRSHIMEFTFESEFRGYHKYNFILEDGTTGHTWISNFGFVPYKVGDYVKYKLLNDKPNKYKFEKVYDEN